MGRLGLRALVGLVVLLAGVGAAQAQMNWLPEVRAGISAQGIESNGLFDPDSIRDANVELLFSAADLNAWMLLGELRPHVGANISFGSATSDIYAGLSWTVQVPVLPVFVEASAGAVLNQALISAPDGDPSRNLGCGAGLRLAASAGLQLPVGFSAIATLEHLPDFGTCGEPNRAASNVMVRLGHRF